MLAFVAQFFPRRLFLSVIVDRRDNEITSFKLTESETTRIKRREIDKEG